MKRIFSLLIPMLAAFAANASVADTLLVEATYVASPMKVTVIAPDIAEDPTVSLPVVYLLNGYDGDYRSWTKIQPRLNELADTYGMIFVMPDGRDSWYWDSPLNPDMQMESFIVKELVPWIDANYPTNPRPERRAITGLSMGGHGGLWLGMRHSDVFGSAGSTSGGVDILPFTSRWKMARNLGPYEGNEQLWADHTVINLVPTLKPGQLNIIFDCGVDDFFAPVNQNLHVALVKAGIDHDYISRPGAHTSRYWANAILYQLLYFNEIFSRP